MIAFRCIRCNVVHHHSRGLAKRAWWYATSRDGELHQECVDCVRHEESAS